MMVELLRDTRGNLAVEFALVLPVFVLLTMGLLEFGFMMRERSTLDAAARAGLQVILEDPTETAEAEVLALEIAPDADVEAIVECQCPDETPTACNTTCSGELPLRFVTVFAAADWDLIFPWPGVDDPMTLESTAEGRTQ